MADPSHVPDLLLERYALGELSAEEKAALEQRLSGSPESSARLESIRRENAAILSAYPPETVVPQIQRRAHLVRTADREAAAQRRKLFSRWPVFLPVGSALAVAALAV